MFYCDSLEIELTETTRRIPKGKKKYVEETNHVGSFKIDHIGVSFEKVGELVEVIENCFEQDPVDVLVKMKSTNCF